ncbi:hypothetical protein MIR68_006841 [Amoeboaphelidium protococcarum]|nr:hypothetical protein MIR68_006841 [Amoeboaphelidium protococcarum]
MAMLLICIVWLVSFSVLQALQQYETQQLIKFAPSLINGSVSKVVVYNDLMLAKSGRNQSCIKLLRPHIPPTVIDQYGLPEINFIEMRKRHPMVEHLKSCFQPLEVGQILDFGMYTVRKNQILFALLSSHQLRVFKASDQTLVTVLNASSIQSIQGLSFKRFLIDDESDYAYILGQSHSLVEDNEQLGPDNKSTSIRKEVLLRVDLFSQQFDQLLTLPELDGVQWETANLISVNDILQLQLKNSSDNSLIAYEVQSQHDAMHLRLQDSKQLLLGYHVDQIYGLEISTLNDHRLVISQHDASGSVQQTVLNLNLSGHSHVFYNYQKWLFVYNGEDQSLMLLNTTDAQNVTSLFKVHLTLVEYSVASMVYNPVQRILILNPLMEINFDLMVVDLQSQLGKYHRFFESFKYYLPDFKDGALTMTKNQTIVLTSEMHQISTDLINIQYVSPQYYSQVTYALIGGVYNACAHLLKVSADSDGSSSVIEKESRFSQQDLIDGRMYIKSVRACSLDLYKMQFNVTDHRGHSLLIWISFLHARPYVATHGGGDYSVKTVDLDITPPPRIKDEAISTRGVMAAKSGHQSEQRAASTADIVVVAVSVSALILSSLTISAFVLIIKRLSKKTGIKNFSQEE